MTFSNQADLAMRADVVRGAPVRNQRSACEPVFSAKGKLPLYQGLPVAGRLQSKEQGRRFHFESAGALNPSRINHWIVTSAGCSSHGVPTSWLPRLCSKSRKASPRTETGRACGNSACEIWGWSMYLS